MEKTLFLDIDLGRIVEVFILLLRVINRSKELSNLDSIYIKTSELLFLFVLFKTEEDEGKSEEFFFFRSVEFGISEIFPSSASPRCKTDIQVETSD